MEKTVKTFQKNKFQEIRVVKSFLWRRSHERLWPGRDVENDRDAAGLGGRAVVGDVDVDDVGARRIRVGNAADDYLERGLF